MKLSKCLFIYMFISLINSLFCFSNELKSNSTRKIDLATAMYLAQKNDVELTKLRFDLKAFRVEHNEAVKNFVPAINLEFNKTNTASVLSNPRGTTVFSFSANLTQTIYDRSLHYTLNKTKSQKLNNRFNIEKRLNDLAKEMITLYYSVLNLKFVAYIKQEEYLKAKDSYFVSKEKLRLTKSIPYDVMLNKAYMIKTHNEWLDAKNEYYRERLKLIRKLNIDEDIDLLLPKIGYGFKIPGLKQALKMAKTNRPDIKAKLNEHRLKKALYEIERSVYYPKIELYSDIRYNQRSGSTEQTDWSIYVLMSMAILDDVKAETKLGLKKYSYLDEPVDEEQLKIKLFDKQSNAVAKARSKSDYMAMKAEIKDIYNNIEQDVLEAYHRLLKEKNNLKLAKLNREIGMEGYKKTRAEYSSGKKDIDDLVESKKQRVQYRLEFRQAILNFRLAIINLKWAIGILWRDFF